MSRLKLPVEAGCPAKTLTSSTTVPDEQSGPTAVKVLKPVSKLTCSVIVKGNGAAACAGTAVPSGANMASATTTNLMMRRVMTPGGLREVEKEPVGETRARSPTIRPDDPRAQVGPRYGPQSRGAALASKRRNDPA